MKDIEKCINFFNRSFRDVADCDYIAARSLYRLQLLDQFLWASLQAIEKYLKAILLYNDCTLLRSNGKNKYAHDLEKLFNDVIKIPDIPFNFPDGIEKFLKYLTIYGGDRYFSQTTYTLGRELLDLDKYVWHIRKYCFYMKGESSPGPDGKRYQFYPDNIEFLETIKLENKIKYRFFTGYLEKVLDNKKGIYSKQREILVWKNFYFGKRKKKEIKNPPCYSFTKNPDHYLEPEIYDILKTRVKFPKGMDEYIESLKITK